MRITKENIKAISVYVIFALIIVAIAMSGCTTSFHNWWATNETDLKTSVHAGTLIVIKKYPEKAPMMTRTIKDIQTGIAVGTLTNAKMVSDFLQKQLALQDLTPAEYIVMNDFTESIQQKLIKAFESMKITNPADELVEINKVLGWALEITSL